MTAPHELRQLRHTPLHSPPLCASSSRFSVEGRFSCSGVALAHSHGGTIPCDTCADWCLSTALCAAFVYKGDGHCAFYSHCARQNEGDGHALYTKLPPSPPVEMP
jgi:hypothetical protein